MVVWVYDERFKMRVPRTMPTYVMDAFDCYKKKLVDSETVSKVCKEMSKWNCNLAWLCLLFDQSAFYGFLKALERRERR